MYSFQSTRPARGATIILTSDSFSVCISIHAPREGRDDLIPNDLTLDVISIHAPREGRDGLLFYGSGSGSYFNPRAPRGARRRYFR